MFSNRDCDSDLGFIISVLGKAEASAYLQVNSGSDSLLDKTGELGTVLQEYRVSHNMLPSHCTGGVGISMNLSLILVLV